MNSIPFAKMTGAGNDFIIIDARAADFQIRLQSVFDESDRSKLSRGLCRRGLSVGADGVVFVVTATGADFGWDFYNSDGSTAEMCGNAARCVARFAHRNGIAGEEMKIKTSAGIIKAKVLPQERVQIMMLNPKLIEKEPPYLIDSGVPHVVIKAAKLNDTRELREQVGSQRFHAKAGPRGANVTFYSPTDAGKIDAISFERGVEDFTLACGTGALAAAFAAKLEAPGATGFQVRMPGGRLEVEFPSDQSVVVLTGPAHFVAEGQLTKEAIHEEF